MLWYEKKIQFAKQCASKPVETQREEMILFFIVNKNNFKSNQQQLLSLFQFCRCSYTILINKKYYNFNMKLTLRSFQIESWIDVINSIFLWWEIRL